MTDTTARDALERWIACQLGRFSYSELKTIAVRVERLGKAISDYGNLDLATDRRIWKVEGAYEGVDRGWYDDAELVFEHDPAFADVRAQRSKERVRAFIQADQAAAWERLVCDTNTSTPFDDEPTQSRAVAYRNASAEGVAVAVPGDWAQRMTGLTDAELAALEPADGAFAGPASTAEYPNGTDTPCDECAALPGTLHRSGCSWTVIVPANSEVA